LAKPIDCLVFLTSLMDQPRANVGVIVSAIEALLKAPVRERRRSCGAFHCDEMIQRRICPGIPNQRTAPVLFQLEKPTGETLPVAIADEIPAVLAQDIVNIGIGIPSQRTPHELV